LNFEPKTRPKKIDARFIDNGDLGQFAFAYIRKYNHYFIFSDNKNEEVNFSTKYNHVMDLWAINEDGTTVYILDGLFIDLSSTVYTSETSTPTTFQDLTLVTDDGSYDDIEESRGPMMKMYDGKDASTSTVEFTTSANITVHAAPDPNEFVDMDMPRKDSHRFTK
jgi:hypothetical protein